MNIFRMLPLSPAVYGFFIKQLAATLKATKPSLWVFTRIDKNPPSATNFELWRAAPSGCCSLRLPRMPEEFVRIGSDIGHFSARTGEAISTRYAI
jgi:hypothetical protein